MLHIVNIVTSALVFAALLLVLLLAGGLALPSGMYMYMYGNMVISYSLVVYSEWVGLLHDKYIY